MSYTEQPPEVVAQHIPVGAFFHIPILYKTKVITRTIDGRSVKIQLWKGFCPSYLPDMVGGVGAEVGLYKRSAVDGLWYPDYPHKKRIWFRLKAKNSGDTIVTAAFKKCWWRHKWMTTSSYAVYKATHWNAPVISDDFKLYFKIEGTDTVIDESW